ncbi:MAG: PadR family transcriptional regulator [Candidatus Hodarchaeales archaeon]
MSFEDLLKKWTIEFKKGFSKPLILLTLAEVEKSKAYQLTKLISKLTNEEIDINASNIYPMLAKLEEEQFIESQIGEDERKFYTLTETGKEFLERLKTSIQKFNSTILEIINNKQTPGDM